MNLELLVLIIALFVVVNSEKLNIDIIEAFEKDKNTYATYRESLMELSCKLLAYSKLRAMFETKSYDIFFVHPGIKNDKKRFYHYIKLQIINKCKKRATKVDVYIIKYLISR